MFKSIRQRITATFTLLVVCAVIAAGVVVTLLTSSVYCNRFDKMINATFSDEFRTQLADTANAASVLQPANENGEGLVLGIDESANIESIKELIYASELFNPDNGLYLAILDSTGQIKYSSCDAEEFNESRIAKDAVKGTESARSGISANVLEFAMPIKDGENVRYAVYIQDPMTAQKGLLRRLLLTFIALIPICAAIAYVLAIIFAKSVSAPLKSLADKAAKLADGDTSALSKSQGNDEISELTNALLYLSDSKREITENATAEKTKLEAILQNMSDGLMAFDDSGKLTHINPEAQRLLNRKFVDDITFNKFFKEINADIAIESLQYMPKEGPTEREVTINDHVLQLSFAPVSRSTNDGGVIVIIHDITKHEKLERSRRDFVANVSHELRTPITVIKSYADILADSPDAEPQLRTRFLGTISSETDRMAKIISDLLTLSSLDENASYARPSEDIHIRSMLEGLVERLSLTAKKKEQTLIYTPINDVPKIKGDRDALERVFTNIISNALKYTPTGGEIQVFSSKVYDDILIKVSDNGIGISKEQLPNIFDRFYRVDKARSRDKGGTGLGLAIAKQTIETVFKGKILISSELNKGTDVTLIIPIQKK